MARPHPTMGKSVARARGKVTPASSVLPGQVGKKEAGASRAPRSSGRSATCRATTRSRRWEAGGGVGKSAAWGATDRSADRGATDPRIAAEDRRETVVQAEPAVRAARVAMAELRATFTSHTTRPYRLLPR